jgi:uncharacterized protein (DUF2267 family)
MNLETKITRVQELAADETSNQARNLIIAVLETLGERLSKAERENGTSQLPKKLKGTLLKRSTTQGFGMEEFSKRVHARADIGFPHAVKGTRAVM